MHLNAHPLKSERKCCKNVFTLFTSKIIFSIGRSNSPVKGLIQIPNIQKIIKMKFL
jgi:hypothetical protein